MPAKLDRCVEDVMKKGKDKSSAFAICTASLQRAGVLEKKAVSANLIRRAAQQAGKKAELYKDLAREAFLPDKVKRYAGLAEKYELQHGRLGLAGMGKGKAKKLFGIF